MPITVNIEPASVDNIWRALSAPATNRRGHWASHRSLPAEFASINPTAKTILPTTISEGINQKLDRRLLQSCLALFMEHAGTCGVESTHEHCPHTTADGPEPHAAKDGWIATR